MKKAAQRFLGGSAGVALVIATSQAAASGFQLMEQNASGLGNAYAGQAASAQDASTIFFNPAGMTKLPGKNAVGAINAIKPTVEFTNTGSTAAPLQPFLGNNGGDAGDWAFVPNAYFSWQLTPQIFVGIGATAPYGLKTEYDPQWIGRFHAVESELRTINVNPSVAMKLSDTLSVGVGINYQRADATLSNAVNYSAAAFGAGGAPLLAAIGGPGTSGIATVKGHDETWGFNAGVMFDLNRNTRIGASYRSAMAYTIEGDVSFENRPALLAGGLPNGAVTADVKLPAIASISVFHKLSPEVDLLADVGYTRWRSLQTLNIRRANGALLSTTPLNWEDSWRVGVGANFHFDDFWTLRVGVAYDQSGVRGADRTPRIPDSDRTWLALGAQYRVSKQFAVDVGYAHIFVKEAGVNLCGPAQAAANPAACAGRNNLVADYQDNAVDILSAQMRYAF